MTKTRRDFTPEFKREAVALLASSGRPLMQVATELGISPSMLRNWRTVVHGGIPRSRAGSKGSATADLHRLADWFEVCGVTSVVMESTGVYWIPVFEILQDRGLEVFLVNARDAKQVPGRKTDVKDAQWLQRLHAYGLLRASFQPKAEIAELRAYLRQRERLLDYAASHIQHMQKALTVMNLQLHHVVSDITGATGMRIIHAILAGERDPGVLASLRDTRCHSSLETIEKALTGHYRAEHLFALEQALALYDTYQHKVAACDQRIEAVLKALSPRKRTPSKVISAAAMATLMIVRVRPEPLRPKSCRSASAHLRTSKRAIGVPERGHLFTGNFPGSPSADGNFGKEHSGTGFRKADHACTKQPDWRGRYPPILGSMAEAYCWGTWDFISNRHAIGTANVAARALAQKTERRPIWLAR
jgi:transposase